MQVDKVYFQSDREQSLYSEGVLFGLKQDPHSVPDSNEVLTHREAYVFQQGILVALASDEERS